MPSALERSIRKTVATVTSVRLLEWGMGSGAAIAMLVGAKADVVPCRTPRGSRSAEWSKMESLNELGPQAENGGACSDMPSIHIRVTIGGCEQVSIRQLCWKSGLAGESRRFHIGVTVHEQIHTHGTTVNCGSPPG